ncbi:MAG: molecular chaperone TorD family protein [Syntrophobacteraceae bacterium]
MAQPAVAFMTAAPPIVRSSIYRLLAAAFMYPTPKLFQSHRDGVFLAELWESMSQLPHLQALVEEEAEMTRRFQSDLMGMSFQDLEVSYTQTFEVGAPKPPCPPYEGLYRSGVERTRLMVEVSEFYKHFGLSMSREEGKRELPDHLSAELEFLHFLTFKEAQAVEEETPDLLKGYVLAQRDFLERHMVSWLPSFCDKLQHSRQKPLYRDLARITLRFVWADLEWTQSRLQELEQP